MWPFCILSSIREIGLVLSTQMGFNASSPTRWRWRKIGGSANCGKVTSPRMTCRRDADVPDSDWSTSLSKQESSNSFRILSTGTPDIEVSKNTKKWRPGGFAVHLHFLTRFSLSSSLIIRSLPSSHFDLLFFCRDMSVNKKCQIVGLKAILSKKSNFMQFCIEYYWRPSIYGEICEEKWWVAWQILNLSIITFKTYRCDLICQSNSLRISSESLHEIQIFLKIEDYKYFRHIISTHFFTITLINRPFSAFPPIFSISIKTFGILTNSQNASPRKVRTPAPSLRNGSWGWIGVLSRSERCTMRWNLEERGIKRILTE
jgi:hypothetical protein